MTSYNDSVAMAFSSISVTATVADPTATIRVRVNTGSWQPISSGSLSAALALTQIVPNFNAVDVMVTAQDATTTILYVITVARDAPLSTNANLSGLSSARGLFLLPLIPRLPATAIPFQMLFQVLTVTPTASDPTATIQVRINEGGWQPIISGIASGPLSTTNIVPIPTP